MGDSRKQYSRRSIRLKEYGYASPWEYFVIICTHDHHCLFGEVAGGKMQLNRFGKIAWREWQCTESLRDCVVLDAFVIMPNHMHAIVLGITSMPERGNQPNDGAQPVGAYGHTPLPRIGNIFRGGHSDREFGTPT